MARDRLRDPGLIERQRTQARIASDIGIGGRVKVGNVGGGGGGFAALTPPAIGRGNRIEHVTLHAEASQTIASVGAGVTWDRIASAPTEVRGFASLVDDLADTGSVVAIPIDVTGVMNWALLGRWAEDDEGASGTLTVTLLRHEVTHAEIAFDLGPCLTQYFGGGDDGWEVRAGDEIRVTVDNDTAGDVTLESLRMSLKILEVANATSPVTPTGGYWVRMWPDGATFSVERYEGGEVATLQDTAQATSQQTFYWIRARVDKGRIRARLWADGDSEPSTWTIDVYDPAPLSRGYAGIGGALGSPTASARQIDTFEVTHDGGSAQSTDFSEYPAGSAPADWIEIAGQADTQWTVATLGTFTGGAFLRYAGDSVGSWIGWETAGTGDTTEVLARVRTANSEDSVGVVLRGTPL